MVADVDFCTFFGLAGLTGHVKDLFTVKQLGTEKEEPPLVRRGHKLLLPAPTLTYV